MLLIFFLDAIRFDCLNRTDTPFLCKLAEEGISGPLQTILGFDGIAPTIFAGVFPDVHKVWTQHLLADEDGLYDWIRPFSSILEAFDKGIEEIDLLRKAFRFALLRASLFRSNRSFYPGINRVPISSLPRFDFSMKHCLYEKSAFHPIPTLFDLLREDRISFAAFDHQAFQSDQNVVGRVLRMSSLPEVAYIRLMDLDEISHQYGVFSEQRKNALRVLDRNLSELVGHFRLKEGDPSIVLFADHGFIDVRRYIDVMSSVLKHGLVEGKDFIVFLDSTMARFWAEGHILTKISGILHRLGNGRVLTDSDIHKYHIPSLRSYGELIYLAEPGVVILPNYYQGNHRVLGMHGYDPFIPEMNTILTIYHRDVKPRRIDSCTLVDIFPTILDILNIPKPSHCSGLSRLYE